MSEEQLDEFLERYRFNLDMRRVKKKLRAERKKFKLSEESIKLILDNQVMPEEKDIRYVLYKAKTSNSYYVKFWKGKCYVTARISDHTTTSGAIGSVIDEETTKAEIVAMLKQRIIALKRKSEAHAFDIVEKSLRKKV